MRPEADSQTAAAVPLGKLAMLVRLDGCLRVCQTLELVIESEMESVRLRLGWSTAYLKNFGL